MKQSKSQDGARKDSIALTQEARRHQLANKAELLAEQRVEDGTASNDLLKFLIARDDLESQLKIEQLEKQNKLLEAKTEALQQAATMGEMYAEAMMMFKKYSGVEEEIND